MSKEAFDILENTSGLTEDLKFYKDGLHRGYMLASVLTEYMRLYKDIDSCFKKNTPFDVAIIENIEQLLSEVKKQKSCLEALNLNPIDIMGGVFVRNREIFEFFIYNLDLMKKSIDTNKRIPDERLELDDEKWW